MLPYRKGEKKMRKLRKRVRHDYTNTGKGNYNAIHKKSVYEVEYNDGTTDQLEANVIAKNMLSQVDSEGHHYQVLTKVTDHKRDDIAKDNVDGFIRSSIENPHQKRGTHGWKILVECKYGSVDWVPLKDLKQSNPVDLSEYVMNLRSTGGLRRLFDSEIVLLPR